jgi:hypothetical protein
MTEESPEPVDDCGVVGVFVGVDAADDIAVFCCHDEIRSSVGTDRTVGEPVGRSDRSVMGF